MLFPTLPGVFTAQLLRKKTATRASWMLWWFVPTLICLIVDLGWPSTLLYALIGVAQRRAPDPLSYAARHSKCEIIGNPDFYGLGIRLGIYLQWFSSLLAGPSESESLLGNYLVFALALYVTFFVFTFGNSCTFVAEVAIMLLIFFGGIYIMLIARFYRKRKSPNAPNAPQKSHIGQTILFDLLIFPMVLYGCWFWCRMAMGRIKPFAASPCGTTLFLFGRVTPRRVKVASGFMAFVFIYTLLAVCFYQLAQLLYWFLPIYNAWLSQRNGDASSEQPAQNPAPAPSITESEQSISPSLRRFAQITAETDTTDPDFFRQCTFWMVYLMPFSVFLYLLFSVVWLLLWIIGQRKKFDDFLEKEEGDGTTAHGKNLMPVALYIFAAIILSILGVELTLVWNSISGVYDINSSGQLIPMIIGMGILGQVLWKKLTGSFETMTEHFFGRPTGAANQIEGGRAEDIEAGTSFQLPDGRWMNISSHVPPTTPDPAP